MSAAGLLETTFPRQQDAPVMPRPADPATTDKGKSRAREPVETPVESALAQLPAAGESNCPKWTSDPVGHCDHLSPMSIKGKAKAKVATLGGAAVFSPSDLYDVHPSPSLADRVGESSRTRTTDHDADARLPLKTDLEQPDLGEPFAFDFESTAGQDHRRRGPSIRAASQAPSDWSSVTHFDLRSSGRLHGLARGHSGKRTYADVSTSPQSSPVSAPLSIELADRASDPISSKDRTSSTRVASYRSSEAPVGEASIAGPSSSTVAQSVERTRAAGTSGLRHRGSNKRRRPDVITSEGSVVATTASDTSITFSDRSSFETRDSVDDLRAMIEARNTLLDSPSEVTSGSLAPHSSNPEAMLMSDATPSVSAEHRLAVSRERRARHSDGHEHEQGSQSPRPSAQSDSEVILQDGDAIAIVPPSESPFDHPRENLPSLRSPNLGRAAMNRDLVGLRTRPSLLQNASTDSMGADSSQPGLRTRFGARVRLAEDNLVSVDEREAVTAMDRERAPLSRWASTDRTSPSNYVLRRSQVLSEHLAELQSRVDSTAVELAHWRARSEDTRQRLASEESRFQRVDPTRSSRPAELSARIGFDLYPPLASLPSEVPVTDRNVARASGDDDIRQLAAAQPQAQVDTGSSDPFASAPLERRSGSIGAAGRVRGPTRRANEIWLGLGTGRDRPADVDGTHQEVARATARLSGRDSLSGPLPPHRTDERLDTSLFRRSVAATTTEGSLARFGVRRETPSRIAAPQLPDLRARSPLSLPFATPPSVTSGGSHELRGATSDQLSEPPNIRSGLRPLTLSTRLVRSEGPRRTSNLPASIFLDDEALDSGSDAADSILPRATSEASMLAAGQAGRRWSPYGSGPTHSQDSGMRRPPPRELMMASAARSGSASPLARSSDGTSPDEGRVSTRRRAPEAHDGLPALDIPDEDARRGTEIALLEQIARRRTRRRELVSSLVQETARRTSGAAPSHETVLSDPLENEALVMQHSGSALQYDGSFANWRTPSSLSYGQPPASTSASSRDETSRSHLRRAELLNAAFTARGLRGNVQSEQATPTTSATMSSTAGEPVRPRNDGVHRHNLLSDAGGEREGERNPDLRGFRRVSEDLWARDRNDADRTSTARRAGAGLAPEGRDSESPLEYISRLLRHEGSSLSQSSSRTTRPPPHSWAEAFRSDTSSANWLDELHPGPWTSISRIESSLRMLRRDYVGLASDPANYLSDDEWDAGNSYEDLLLLSSRLGDALPKFIPPHVVSCFPTCLYSQWGGGSCERPLSPPPVAGKGKQRLDDDAVALTASRDTSCAICLDDYDDADRIMSVPGCNHAFHAGCLSTWFETARTCPFCRADAGKAWTATGTKVRERNVPQL